MELHLEIIGCILIVLGLMHMVIPSYAKWKKELPALSLLNKQLMQVHTFFIAFVVFLIGILCLVSAADFVHTKLGRQLSLCLFVFWFTRLIFQFAVFSPMLWKGKKFETTMHIIFSVLWAYFTVVFFLIYWGNMT